MLNADNEIIFFFKDVIASKWKGFNMKKDEWNQIQSENYGRGRMHSEYIIWKMKVDLLEDVRVDRWIYGGYSKW